MFINADGAEVSYEKTLFPNLKAIQISSVIKGGCLLYTVCYHLLKKKPSLGTYTEVVKLS